MIWTPFHTHFVGTSGLEIAAGHAGQTDEVLLVEAQRGLDSAHVNDLHAARQAVAAARGLHGFQDPRRRGTTKWNTSLSQVAIASTRPAWLSFAQDALCFATCLDHRARQGFEQPGHVMHGLCESAVVLSSPALPRRALASSTTATSNAPARR